MIHEKWEMINISQSKKQKYKHRKHPSFLCFFFFIMLASYYQVLKELIAMKSISLNADYMDDIEKIAIYLNAMLQDNGFDSEIFHGYGNPIVLGKYFVDTSLPTMLLYCHYDVQIANEQWWNVSPFSLYIGKEKIYGRGVADNKWQFLIYLLTLFDLIQSKDLWYNVTILIEGNEKTWSQYIEKFISNHRQELLSDFCLISASHVIGDVPCIDVWYRWGVNLTLTIKTASTDLHSGFYGWIVPNAIHELNKILAKVYDINNKITIPYFYYDVEDVPFDVLVKHKKCKINEQQLSDSWLRTLFKDKDVDMLTQIGLKPTIQITGISGGYMGEWYKNAIPNIASAHINFRIVKNQTAKKVLSAFDQRLQMTLPWYVDYELDVWVMYDAVKIDINNFTIKKAEIVLQNVFGKPVFYTYSWRSLPVVEILERVVNTKPVLVPLVNEDCNMHGVNENFDIDLIEKWFTFAYDFLKK